MIKPLKPTLKTGKKLKVRDTIRSAKDHLAFKEIIGHTQTGKQGFGINEKQRWSKTNDKIARIWSFRVEIARLTIKDS